MPKAIALAQRDRNADDGHASGRCLFPFVPNPNLTPETAHLFEVGLNYKRDGIFTDDDGIRAKAAIYHNTVNDYIGMNTAVVPGVFSGRQSGPSACAGKLVPGLRPVPEFRRGHSQRHRVRGDL